jgi:Zn-dependent protease with chaperone function
MSDLGLTPIKYLYLCPQAFAAVFVRPSIKNIFLIRPKLELAVGMGFLTQLTDKQMKTVLYHEFGHYCQESIRETGSVYRFGQYARMVLADRKDYSSSILYRIRS